MADELDGKVEPLEGLVVQNPGIADDVEAKNQLQIKILHQVEFYFGDINLINDCFINDKSTENRGWFPLHELLKFNRMQKLLETIPQDRQEHLVVTAVQPSKLVEFDQTDKFIRRRDDARRPRIHPYERTVYLKGFDKMNTKSNDLTDFYSKYDGFEGIIKRYYIVKGVIERVDGKTVVIPPSKGFKGSIFIVFKNRQQAEVLMQEENHQYGGVSLIKKWQKDYLNEKAKEAELKKARRQNQGKPEHTARAPTDLPKGALVKVLNVPVGVSREDIKATFQRLMDEKEFPIAFIDFQRGDPTAMIRFGRPGLGKRLLTRIPGFKLPLGGKGGTTRVYCSVELLVEEEESSYLEKVKQQRLDRKRSGKNQIYKGKRSRP